MITSQITDSREAHRPGDFVCSVVIPAPQRPTHTAIPDGLTVLSAEPGRPRHTLSAALSRTARHTLDSARSVRLGTAADVVTEAPTVDTRHAKVDGFPVHPLDKFSDVHTVPTPVPVHLAGTVHGACARGSVIGARALAPVHSARPMHGGALNTDPRREDAVQSSPRRAHRAGVSSVPFAGIAVHPSGTAAHPVTDTRAVPADARAVHGAVYPMPVTSPGAGLVLARPDHDREVGAT